MSTVTTFLNLVKAAIGEQYSLATVNANLDKIDADAVAKNNQAKGLVFSSLVTANSGSVTDAIINNIPSFTFKANRNYRIIWDFSYQHSGNADSLFFCSINTCSTADAANLITGLTTLNGRVKGHETYALAQPWHTGPIIAHYKPAGDTTVQLKFRVTRTSGDDGLTVVGTISEKAIYQIFDDGAQV